MSHCDSTVQAIKTRTMQQQFAMPKAMQDPYRVSRKSHNLQTNEGSATGSDLSREAEEDEDEPPLI